MSSCKAALAPQTLKELCGIVRGNALLLPRGGVTKPTLSKGYGEFTAIDMAQFSGIQEYVPEEFTITVKAGTPIREVAQELAAHGQFLPFDPPFSEDGATIGWKGRRSLQVRLRASAFDWVDRSQVNMVSVWKNANTWRRCSLRRISTR